MSIDFKGDGKVDAFYAGDLIRACNLNPTLKTIADVFPMYKACKDSKDQGGFHDFVEILKLYDKNDDNTMLSHELFRLLTNLGEKLTKEEAKSLMKELCEPADDGASCPSSPSWRGCALLRSKLPTSQVQHCNYHHHRGSLKRAPHVSPVHIGGHLRPRPRGQGKGRHVEHSRKNLILSLQNTKSNVAALLRTRS